MSKRNPYFLFLLLMNPSLLMAQLPPGAVAKYPMDNNSAADVSGNGYNGTLTGTSATANRFGTSNRAVAFVAGTSKGSLPSGLVSAVANDFTIAYWFKTTMTAPSASDWYNGTALVDAEVCNSVNDFGTALINGGSVAMGIGNPDITIVSPGTTYNNGMGRGISSPPFGVKRPGSSLYISTAPRSLLLPVRALPRGRPRPRSAWRITIVKPRVCTRAASMTSSRMAVR